jgi:hypothetical protein
MVPLDGSIALVPLHYSIGGDGAFLRKVPGMIRQERQAKTLPG